MSIYEDIRLATPADVEAIRDLTRVAYAKWVPVIGREPKPMAADYASAIQKHRFDLLYVGDVLAGLIETVDEPNQLLIENVAVSPNFQGRGVGAKLMAHAEDIAASLGHKRVWLYTNQRFAENIAFYLKLGYRVDREEEVGGGTIKVDMSKSLDLEPSKGVIVHYLRARRATPSNATTAAVDGAEQLPNRSANMPANEGPMICPARIGAGCLRRSAAKLSGEYLLGDLPFAVHF